MNPNYQHFFVIRTVEDADVSALGHALHGAPKVIVVEFLSGRSLERIDLATLRIDPRHNMFDRTILARGVHRLEDQKHTPAVLGIEFVLQLGHVRDSCFQQFGRVLFGANIAGVTRIEIFQADFLAIVYAIWFGQLACPAHEVSLLLKVRAEV